MTDLASRPANRLRKPSWRDSRLLAGVLLVLLCTIAGAVVVARADDRVPMYAARVALVPGEPLGAAQLTRVDVQLGSGANQYLSAAEAVSGTDFVLREVRPGELVPRSALGSRSEVAVQPLTINVDATSATNLVRGSLVDVYVNPPRPGVSGPNAYAGPELALHNVSVAAKPDRRSGFGSGGTDTIAISIMAPSDKVATLIGHVDDGAKVTVVPAPGAVTGSGS
ncbi:MAG: hypothetical protein ABI131_06390 [Nostocoides sp.]